MRVEVEVPRGAPVVFDDQVLAPAREALGAGGAEPRPVRLAYAAAHVVLRAGYRAGSADEVVDQIDWPATRGVRERLAARGFAIAEAMDTAQRFELGWPAAARLIEECGRLRPAHGFVAGAGVDHLSAVGGPADLVDGVVEQAQRIQAAGGEVILLPMPWLAEHRVGEAGYLDVYSSIIRQLDGPVYVHWLGEMFNPALRGYFPGDSFAKVMAVDPAVVRGAKLSLLDADLERGVRLRLGERDQIVLTGDDLHFAQLIAGGDPEVHNAVVAQPERWTQVGARRVAMGDFSHALLGVFDAVAEPAGLALRLLARGDGPRYRALMEPAERLGEVLFEPPTRHYKAGLAFLAWLDGVQQNFVLLNREDQARDLDHYVRVARLAGAAGVISDASGAALRLRAWVDAEA